MAKKKPTKKSKPKVFKKDRITLFLGGFIALLALVIYSNTLGHEFALDDIPAIGENYVTKQGFKGISTIWQEHYRFGFWNNAPELYRPLPLTMFAIEWAISPNNPFLHHLINVLFYAGTGLLLFFTLKKILPNKELLIFLAAAIFIAHPVHTEVVANIKSRDEILAFFFFLASLNLLWTYLKNKKIVYLISCLFLYGMALFSKESAITFLALYPLFIYFFRRESWQKEIIKVAWFLIPVVLFFAVRHQIIGGVGYEKSISILDNYLVGIDNSVNQMASIIQLVGKYVWTLIFPITLCSEYGFNQIPTSNFGNWQVILSITVFIGLLIGAIIGIKKRHFLSFCILFYGITFSIFSNMLVLIGSSYGERFLYIPSLGFALAIAFGLTKLVKHKKSYQSFFIINKIPLLLGGLIILGYSAKTIQRIPAWKNSLTLYATDIKTAPNSAKLNYHYGLELSKKGAESNSQNDKKEFYQKAIAAFQKSISIYPKYSDAYGQLGLTNFRAGNSEKAMKYYQKAVQLNGNNAKIYSNMGIIFMQNKEVQNALRVYQKAVELDPAFVDARRNLGAVYAQKGDFKKAIIQFSAGLKYAPNDATLNFYLGSAYRDSGDRVLGQKYLEKAYRLNPTLKK